MNNIPDLLGYFPFQPESADYVLRRSHWESPGVCELGLPIPPPGHLRVSPDYGRTNEEYLRIGKEHTATMRGILARHGFEFPAGAAVLEFGCSAGRMIRWLRPEADRCRIVGADISAEAVYWCQENLGAPFAFVMTTLEPHLPFRDASFDLVFSGSVFTHIDDLADAWLAELARVLKPGGFVYLTIHDEAAIEQLAGPHGGSTFAAYLATLPDYARFVAMDYRKFTLGRGPDAQVFYRRAKFEQMVAPWYHVLSFEAGAYIYQTAAILAAR
jgi:SAM-dependent methyltransferase